MSNVEPDHEHHSKISQGIAPMNQEHDEQLHKGLNTKDMNSTFIITDWMKNSVFCGHHTPDIVIQNGAFPYRKISLVPKIQGETQCTVNSQLPIPML
jgi:hypothetical protein